MLSIFLLFSTSIPKATDLTFPGMIVSPICVQIHVHLDLSMIKLLPGQEAYRAYSSIRMWHSSWVMLWAPPLLQLRILHGGKWVKIPFLKKGIAKHHVVLLEAGGKCPGTAFWWKWLVTVLNLE